MSDNNSENSKLEDQQELLTPEEDLELEASDSNSDDEMSEDEWVGEPVMAQGAEDYKAQGADTDDDDQTDNDGLVDEDESYEAKADEADDGSYEAADDVDDESYEADSGEDEEESYQADTGQEDDESYEADSGHEGDDEAYEADSDTENEREELQASADEVGDDFDAEGTELESFESAEIEEHEFIEEDQIISVVESMLFSTDKPLTMAAFKQAFVGTQVKTKDIKRALDSLAVDYANPVRGVTLEEVNSGYQLRTKVDNMNLLKRTVKSKPFKLSGPALEVLAIAAYKQPCIKAQIDEIRGVESGHLLRALMEKGLVSFAGKSELPGKPMMYQTTRKFLEIFGLRNLKELPSLSEIDELIPEGIGEEEEKESLGDLTESLSKDAGETYSEGEDELLKISGQLDNIATSSDFFEEEKRREKERREAQRAKDIREALEFSEEVDEKDKRWLERYEARLQEEQEAREREAAEAEAAVQNLADAESEPEGVNDESDAEVLEASGETDEEIEASEPAESETMDESFASTDEDGEEIEASSEDSAEGESDDEPWENEELAYVEPLEGEEAMEADDTSSDQSERIGELDFEELGQAVHSFDDESEGEDPADLT